jgi:acetylornithine/succinyldiaminopimelate/putrescine aminotransferase
VFFTNSGAESVEGIIKLVRRWGHAMGKTKIISFTGGFHGRTYGALSLMDKPHYKDKMGPFLPNMQVLRYNNTGDLREYVDANTAAVVLEFIQGEGGITEADPEFIELLEELKLKYGFLVAADEIQSGCGRTGKFFGFDHYGCNPDLVAMAKGIGGGLPLGAILGRESLANVFEKGMHGTTYGGNPVACAAGLAVMNELQSGYIEHAAEMGEYLERALVDIRKEFPDKIAEVRGKGLMKGLALNFDAAPLVEALFAEKIITNAASGTVLRLVPPLVIEKEHIDRLAETISKLLPDMAAE